MRNPHGSFIWYELMTADPEGARAFYGDVIGWTIGDPVPAPVDYRMIGAADGDVGGLLVLTREMCDGGAQPAWLGYFGVDDVDRAVERIVAAGGALHLPPHDVPQAGRIAMVADPQGVAFYVMRGAMDEASNAYHRTAPGHVSWNELLTPDPDAALAFYADQFGYRKDGAMPMGDMGDYSFIVLGGEQPVGAVMRTPPDQRSRWDFYFRVPDIDAARAKVEKGGGTVTFGPQEVPGGEMVLNARDPEGVPFGMVAPGKGLKGERR